jgi:hypothetical protein
MNKNIVHHYFKKEEAGIKKLVQLNPIYFTGIEITIYPSGEVEAIEMETDEEVSAKIIALGFKESSAIEFNLYFSGAISGQYTPQENT